MLCIVLALAFSSASTASVVDRLQHQSGSSADHDHMPFSKVVTDSHDHHHESDAAHPNPSDDTPDHQPGTGHHHHADSSSGLPAPLAQSSSWAGIGTRPWHPTVDDRMPGFLTHGPERPPKSNAIRV